MDEINRDAYFSAYDNAIRRHGQLKTLSAAPAAVKSAASTAAARSVNMNFGEAATRSLRIVWTYFAWTVARIGYYIILPTLAFFLALILLGVPHWERWANETLVQLQQGHWYLQPNYGSVALNTALVIVLCILHPIKVARAVGNGIQVALQDTRAWFEVKLDDIRRHPRTADLLLEYQMIRNWIGRYFFGILYALLLLWLFPGLIGLGGNRYGKTKIVQWKDIQPSFTNPIPEILYRTRNEEGSNSHYRRDESPELAEQIVHEEENDDVDVGELPVETRYDEWDDSPPFKPSIFESSQKSAREGSTAAPHTDTYTSKRSWQEAAHEDMHAGPPRETFVGRSWDEQIRAHMKADMRKRNVRTYVGEGLVYCLSCKQWHCCEVPY